MRIHQQFDLNLSSLKYLGRDNFAIPPFLVEELANKLSRQGYTVLKSSAYYMGIPQSITLIKEFTGPFTAKLSAKIKDDFDMISKSVGVGKLFQ